MKALTRAEVERLYEIYERTHMRDMFVDTARFEFPQVERAELTALWFAFDVAVDDASISYTADDYDRDNEPLDA